MTLMVKAVNIAINSPSIMTTNRFSAFWLRPCLGSALSDVLYRVNVETPLVYYWLAFSRFLCTHVMVRASLRHGNGLVRYWTTSVGSVHKKGRPAVSVLSACERIKEKNKMTTDTMFRCHTSKYKL